MPQKSRARGNRTAPPDDTEVIIDRPTPPAWERVEDPGDPDPDLHRHDGDAAASETDGRWPHWHQGDRRIAWHDHPNHPDITFRAPPEPDPDRDATLALGGNEQAADRLAARLAAAAADDDNATPTPPTSPAPTAAAEQPNPEPPPTQTAAALALMTGNGSRVGADRVFAELSRIVDRAETERADAALRKFEGQTTVELLGLVLEAVDQEADHRPVDHHLIRMITAKANNWASQVGAAPTDTPSP